MASADFSLFVVTACLIGSPARPLQLWTYSFHLMPATFTPAVPYSYRTLVFLATSSTAICLICDFCTSGQMFASGFLQIPSRGGHPCLRLDASHYKGALGTFTAQRIYPVGKAWLIKNKVVPLQHGSYPTAASHPSRCADRQL